MFRYSFISPGLQSLEKGKQKGFGTSGEPYIIYFGAFVAPYLRVAGAYAAGQRLAKPQIGFLLYDSCDFPGRWGMGK
ncbi:MAG: hypothetical protein GX623_00540 [Clostridiales bacterium]|nr:hypothetical protein [Clostridiales bacterium]